MTFSYKTKIDIEVIGDADLPVEKKGGNITNSHLYLYM